MKKIFLLAAGFFVLSTNIFAQKEVIESNIQKRNIGAFTKIESSSGIEVILTKGNKEELGVVVGDQHYINEVKTVVSNGTLKISREGEWKFWNTWKNWKVKVYVSYVNLESIDVSSGSSVKGEG
jgi:ribosomal protein L30E